MRGLRNWRRRRLSWIRLLGVGVATCLLLLMFGFNNASAVSPLNHAVVENHVDDVAMTTTNDLSAILCAHRDLLANTLYVDHTSWFTTSRLAQDEYPTRALVEPSAVANTAEPPVYRQALASTVDLTQQRVTTRHVAGIFDIALTQHRSYALLE